MARTRAKIVDAVVALHAERGARSTSYADIAQRADVAIPTVYKHFPTLEHVFEACVGHVRGQAPPLGPELFAGLASAQDRVAALSQALAERHRYFQPWLRWSVHEAPLIPELAVHHRRMNEAHRALITEAVSPAFAGKPPAALIALLSSLLDFRAWQTLTQEFGLSDSAAAEAMGNAARLVLGGYVAA